jgi:hypothetical protein
MPACRASSRWAGLRIVPARRLSSDTDVRVPFVVAWACEADHPVIDRLAHDRLARYRENACREFFRCDVASAIEAVKACNASHGPRYKLQRRPERAGKGRRPLYQARKCSGSYYGRLCGIRSPCALSVAFWWRSITPEYPFGCHEALSSGLCWRWNTSGKGKLTRCRAIMRACHHDWLFPSTWRRCSFRPRTLDASLAISSGSGHGGGLHPGFVGLLALPVRHHHPPVLLKHGQVSSPKLMLDPERRQCLPHSGDRLQSDHHAFNLGP